MVRIDIRNSASEKYVNVEIEVNDVKIDLGLHDDKQRRELAAELADAVSVLLENDR